MGTPVLSLKSLGTKFGCGMKMIRTRNSRSKFSPDVGGPDFVRFGPNTESASHHYGILFYGNENTNYFSNFEGVNEGVKFLNPNVKAICGCGESFEINT